MLAHRSHVYDLAEGIPRPAAAARPCFLYRDRGGGKTRGDGTVYDSPDGINCGSVCSVSVTAGWRVYLEAVPYLYSTFVGWSGGGCSGTSVCVLEPQADTSVTATFEPEPTPANPECRSNPSVESSPPLPSPPRKPPRRVQRLKCGRGTKRQELPNGEAECVRIEGKRHGH